MLLCSSQVKGRYGEISRDLDNDLIYYLHVCLYFLYQVVFNLMLCSHRARYFPASRRVSMESQ